MNFKKLARKAQLFNFASYIDQGATGSISRFYADNGVQDLDSVDKGMRAALANTKPLILGFDVSLPVMPGRPSFFDTIVRPTEPITVTRKAIKLGADAAIFQALYNHALQRLVGDEIDEVVIPFGEFLAARNVKLSNKANRELFDTTEWDRPAPNDWVVKAMYAGELCNVQVHEDVMEGEGPRNMDHVVFTIKLKAD